MSFAASEFDRGLLKKAAIDRDKYQSEKVLVEPEEAPTDAKRERFLEKVLED
jgi:hypothetical protein